MDIHDTQVEIPYDTIKITLVRGKPSSRLKLTFMREGMDIVTMDHVGDEVTIPVEAGSLKGTLS